MGKRKSKLYPINWEYSAVKEHELKKFKIYAHIEKVEPFRMYVGKTSKSLAQRFGGTYWGRFGEHLKTHPLTEFDHIVLTTTDDPVEAKRLEEYYTEQFCTTDPRFGFNTQVGDVPSEKTHEAVMEYWQEGGASREANCIYTYTIRHPNGNITETHNMREFCKEHNINQGNMASRGHSKGFQVISKELKNK